MGDRYQSSSMLGLGLYAPTPPYNSHPSQKPKSFLGPQRKDSDILQILYGANIYIFGLVE